MPDWNCPSCQALNVHEARSCTLCGGSPREKQTIEAASVADLESVLGAIRDEAVETVANEAEVQGPPTGDRDILQKLSVALLDMHGEHRVADSPTARMVLRRIGYIMSGMPPEVAEKMERMFRHESR